MEVFKKPDAMEQKMRDVTDLSHTLYDKNVAVMDRMMAAHNLGRTAVENPELRGQVAEKLKDALSGGNPGIANTAADAMGKCKEGAVPYIHELVDALGRVSERSAYNTLADALIAIGNTSPEAAGKVEQKLDEMITSSGLTHERDLAIRRIGAGIMEHAETKGSGESAAVA